MQKCPLTPEAEVLGHGTDAESDSALDHQRRRVLSVEFEVPGGVDDFPRKYDRKELWSGVGGVRGDPSGAKGRTGGASAVAHAFRITLRLVAP